MKRLPPWLIKRIPKQENIKKMRAILAETPLHTVCESAKCPNIGECFSKNTLTFMILGDICTRSCRFCGVKKGKPLPVDDNEPLKIKKAVKLLGLDYVVITSVTRDDLADGGAHHFKNVIQTLSPLPVEVLIPDLKGSEKDLAIILSAHPLVLNHNLETIERLYPSVRPEANYQRSLHLLKKAKEIQKKTYTKSGFMVGLGENREEVVKLLSDLRSVNCDLVTIGQYLRPTRDSLEVQEFILPELFLEYQRIGQDMGIKKVVAGPFVRSSYKAKELWKKQKDS